MNPNMMGGMMNPNMMSCMPGMMPGMMGGMPGVMPGMGQMMPGMMPGMVGGNQMNMNMGNMNNAEEEEEWMKGFKMAVQEVNSSIDPDDNKPGPRINIIFNTTQGTSHNIAVPHGTTVNQALEKYLKRIGKPELIGTQESKICFLWNANKMRFGDNTPVEQFFKNMQMPKIVVNDVNNLIGA